jgi:hypothetical protein
MNWYLTKIVFRIICGDGNHTAQFDEQLRLISAEDKKSAFIKARQIGQCEEEIFLNVKQEPVHWKFINVSEVYKLGELLDGAELFSRIDEKGDADGYIDIINDKASGIIHSDSHELLQLV